MDSCGGNPSLKVLRIIRVGLPTEWPCHWRKLYFYLLCRGSVSASLHLRGGGVPGAGPFLTVSAPPCICCICISACLHTPFVPRRSICIQLQMRGRGRSPAPALSAAERRVAKPGVQTRSFMENRRRRLSDAAVFQANVAAEMSFFCIAAAAADACARVCACVCVCV